MNSLGQNLKFRAVIMRENVLDKSINPDEHPFLVLDGFGASSFMGGTAVYGVFLSDGEEKRQDSNDIERFATLEEVEKAHMSESVLEDRSLSAKQVTS